MCSLLLLPVVDAVALHCLICHTRNDLPPNAPMVQTVKAFVLAHAHGGPRIEFPEQLGPVD